jgi:predicted DCC family thiol-disulfide oxidoreductase YuxK
VTRRALVSLSALTAWLIFSTQIVPPLITRAYHGQSLPLFNALIISRADHPLAEYLSYWRNVAWLGAFWCIAVWVMGPLRRTLASPVFFDRVVGAATAGTLGAIRAWVCGILLVMTLWEDLASTALLPRSMLQPKGVLHLLHAAPIGFERFLASAPALWALEHATALVLFFGVLGFATRFVIPAGAVCSLLVAGILREYSWFYHTGLIPIYALAVLSFTPCGDGFSIDRILRIARGTSVPSLSEPRAAYGWSRYAVWTVIAVPYVAAGLSKLYYSGFAWLHPDNMKATLLRTTLAPMEFSWTFSIDLLRGPDSVFVALAVAGLFTELLFGLVLVSRIARRVLPAAMALTHMGILFLQNILFVDLILLQGVFYDFIPVRRRIGASVLRRHGPVQVLYDGECGLCQRSVGILQGLDLLGHLSWVDFRNTRVDVDVSRLEHEMAAMSRGRTHFGFSAYRAISWRIPVLWPALPFLHLPGMRQVGDAVYAWVAKRRHGICRIDLQMAAHVGDERRVHARGAAACLAIAAFLISWWITHIEFYPLTTMKMFAAMNEPLGRISYIKPIAFYEDGSSAPARFERWIGAMADGRYRRVVTFPFDDRQNAGVTSQFLAASMQAANRLPGNKKVVRFDLQLWEWDFAADPANPSMGRMVNSFRYPSSETE